MFTQKMKAALGAVGDFAAANPLSTMMLAIGAGVFVYQAVTTPQGAIAAAKGAATLVGGLAITSLVTTGMVAWGNEMNSMVGRGLEKASDAVHKFNERPELRQATS